MANMNDVAKKAGVSRGTVSNYINNVKIKESSKQKIEEAIKELGYIPNIAARELKTNKASNVVFILPTVWNPFFSELTYYLQLELKKIGKKMLLCNSHDDYLTEIEYIEMAKQNKVYGIISVSYSNILPYLIKNLPYVAIERYYNESIPYVTSDNINGGKLAVKELYKRKCNNLLHITREIEYNKALNDIKFCFETACKDLNLNYTIFSSNCKSSEFRKEVDKFIKESYNTNIKFDGIFCATDRYAEYVVEILEEMRIKIPQDVQIIGFDGAKSYPNEHLKISTIKQDIEKLAIEAVNTLQSVVNKSDTIINKVLPVNFLEVETTKKINL